MKRPLAQVIKMPRRPEAAGDPWAPLLPSQPLLFALIFCVIWILHAPLLRLPYFWDEAGYFVPVAHDLLLTGDPIARTTLSTGHPPLVPAWLALWWKVSAFTPAVTRTAMLLVAAFTLIGVFRLARRVSNIEVAAAATLLTALYPVFFSQSSLAHLDMAAAALTLWGLGSYVSGKRLQAVIWFALAGLAKETAVVAPLGLAAWELVVALASSPAGPMRIRKWIGSIDAKLSTALALAASALPLAGWFIYHWARTGRAFGDPVYFSYNVTATLNPFRVVLAFFERLWQLLGYLNMFVLAGAAALAMKYARPLKQAALAGVPARSSIYSGSDDEQDATLRPRIAVPTQLVFAVVILSNLAAFSVVGGAVLARYLLPVYPLLIILCVSTLWRRLEWWRAAVGITALAFAIGLFTSPPYGISPEDNLTYADYVRLHKSAAERLAATPGAHILTAWPASDELRLPYLGYVSRPFTVTRIENFSSEQLDRAVLSKFDYALLFSTKYGTAHGWPGWWERMQSRYFDYHRDLDPQSAARALNGSLIYEAHRGPEWVAIVQRK